LQEKRQRKAKNSEQYTGRQVSLVEKPSNTERTDGGSRMNSGSVLDENEAEGEEEGEEE
jgi:hypothetical protein